jgi:pyrroline-5-carboxylate reductase
MGQAVVEGGVRRGVLEPSTVVVVEPDAAKRDAARALLGPTAVVSASPAAARGAEQVLLAVKPQSFPSVGPALGDRPRRTIFISVMAGLDGAAILRAIGGAHAVVRTMPNTPCRIGLGTTGLALAAGAREGDDALAAALFGALGRVVRVPETMLDAVTATSGSGPAYLFLVAEAWEDAAVALGFDRATARDLVRQTILGAAHMLEDRAVDARELRSAVTSRGGTTAAAIAVLDEDRVRSLFRDALAAAEARGRALAREAGGLQ